MKTIIYAACILLLLNSCNRNGKSDAYGNFESDEVMVSAENQGKIVTINIEEGQLLKKGDTALIIDTIQLQLKKLQLMASCNAVRSKHSQVYAQTAVQDEQMQTLLREKKRLESLIRDSAAPTKQLDDIESNIKQVNRQIESIRTQNSGISGETEALEMQISQIEDQIRRSVIINPIDGMVLEKYIEYSEIASPGKVLYKIADLSQLTLRAYVTGSQLPQIAIGQKVTVFIDKDKKENQPLEGTISWISSQAEFTPKIIQTKEERVNQVYAIKVIVKNDGRIKIGMPGEVAFQ